jgi:hypothetical protein
LSWAALVATTSADPDCFDIEGPLTFTGCVDVGGLYNSCDDNADDSEAEAFLP